MAKTGGGSSGRSARGGLQFFDEPVMLVRNLDTGELVPLEQAASAAIAARINVRAADQLPDPSAADGLVPQIRRLALSGGAPPLVGSEVRVEVEFAVRGCTHTTRWRRLATARDDEDGGVVATGDAYAVCVDDLGRVLVADVAPTGPNGARGLSGTASTTVVRLQPALRARLLAALARTQASFELELEETTGAPPPAAAAAAAAAARRVEPGAPRAAASRPVKVLLSEDGLQIRTRTRGAGAGRAARRNAALVDVGWSDRLSVRAPAAQPCRLALVLDGTTPPLWLVARSVDERDTVVLALRAFACHGSARTGIGLALWGRAVPTPAAADDDADEASSACARAPPCVGGHVQLTGNAVVGGTLRAQLPAAAAAAGGAAAGRGRGGATAAAASGGVRALRISWRRSRPGVSAQLACLGSCVIDGAHGLEYVCTADDVACVVAVVVVPVGSDGEIGVSAHAATTTRVALPPALSARLDAARLAGEASFAAIDVSALAGAEVRKFQFKTSGALGACQLTLARTVAGSRLAYGVPPTAERTLILNAQKLKLRFGRRTLVKTELNEATDARIVGFSSLGEDAGAPHGSAAVEAAAAGMGATEAKRLRGCAPVCIRMSATLALDLLFTSAGERDAAVLILRQFAMQRCKQLGGRWWGAAVESDGDDDDDDDEVG